LSKLDIEDNTPLSSTSYESDDENTLNSSFKKSSISGESNYDLSYYFHPDRSTGTNTLSPISTIISSEGEKMKNEKDDFKISNPLYRARSLSIGSTVSAHFINNVSTKTATAFNKYNSPTGSFKDDDTVVVKEDVEKKAAPTCKLQQHLFKMKTDKSNKKTFQFFGEQVKLDISAKEIKKEGLKALLYSSIPLGYFLYHLLNEYSSENLVKMKKKKELEVTLILIKHIILVLLSSSRKLSKV
jgi:hypothetical protein